MHRAKIVFLLLAVLVMAFAARAEVGGKITGVVRDQSGSVIAGATVVISNAQTGAKLTATTDQDGVFTFPVLSVGQYQIDVTADAFRPYSKTGLVIDINSALALDVTLQVNEQDQSIVVTESSAQVETTDTQLGQVLGSTKVTEIPLNGRSYTDLFATQVGVTPLTTSGAGNSTSGGGFGTVPVAGATNTGQFSINGQREDANGFSINGANVQEGIGQQAGIIPNLDSIAEFRILTSNTDAQYGNYSGGLINVVTKSGGNAFHGSGFEFLRNTDLDAKNYFSSQRSTFQQNQYGGTLGGPIKQNRLFFFADYQGQHTKQGQDTGVVSVPSLANRTGNFSDSPAFTGTVNGPYLAQTLSNLLGRPVTQSESYSSVFPGNVIPESAFSIPATKLLQFIPSANLGANGFESTSEALTLHDEKAAGRIDWNTDRSGNFSFYYFFDKYNLDNPYPSGFGGATVPNPNGGAFNATSSGVDQLFVVSNTKTFGSTLVNEARLSATRLNNNLGVPQGGVGTTLAQQGITAGGQGIVQGAPQFAGVETLYFNSFTAGTEPFFVAQINNTFDASDTVSKVRANHTMKFGFEYIWYKVKQNPDLVANGTFSFFGSGNQSTGNGFADFLLGLPDFYSQQSSPAFYESAANGGIFAQDSWRIRPNITVNYGLRWDYITPWAEKHHQTTTFVQGVESTTFPGAPLGYLVPGDPLPDGSHIPAAIAPTPLDNFSPRLGIAYSPNYSSGWLNKLTGGPGKTSIRAGAGRFFTAVEGLTIAYPTGNPPYGLTYTSPEAPIMASPFIGALTGTNFIQQFPVNVPGYNVSATNPDPNVDWSRYTPISGAGSVYPHNKTPYTMSANLTVERQLGSNTVLSIGFIGSFSRHLLAVHSVSPGNPALCLSLSQPQDVLPGTPTCGPFGENTVYTRADGTIVTGTRAPFPNTIGTDAVYQNMGNANYNSLQTSLKRTAGRFTFLASYTYGKSMDWASSIQEQVNPFDFRKEYAISAFDLKHNFVFSYNYELPIDKLLRKSNRLTQGWAISGVTRFATGLPVTFQSFGDNALVQVQNNGVNSVSIDLPDYNPSLGALDINHNPRNNPMAFNTELFSPNALGTFGNSSRRFFYGPGINNYDVGLRKTTRITESASLEFRFETFNTFNHAQFDGANSVDGNISNSTFGQILKSQPGRVSQVALKLSF
ncbi:MAG TPA: carboxypeptidase regulatory-like domain-containing protein [Candidatus Saccharimonadales bacterium]|nr:carboxypeptidase regulatory-like domain-containing protein [Candidatus Saccharimonadales bacterium]